MSYTYSLIIELRRRGLSYREISKTLHVSQATVARVLKQKASRKSSVMRKTQEGVFKAQGSEMESESAFQPSQKSVLVNRREALSCFEGLEKAKSAFQHPAKASEGVKGLKHESAPLSYPEEALSGARPESSYETQKGVRDGEKSAFERSAFQPSLKSAFDRPSFLISSPEALSGFREAELLHRVSWLEEEVRRLHEALAREQAISYELSQRVKELEQALPKPSKKRWWRFW
jgi:transcriptional regulator with XRE-family HTH domain